MSEFQKSIQQQLKQFDSRYANNKILQQLEARTNIPKSYIVFGLVIVYFLLLLANIGGIGEILANIVGFALPAYLSLIALKTPGSADDTQLLTYWVVYAFFSVIEFWSVALTYLIPFYWFIKTIFLVYIALPQTGGANMIYKKVIDPATSKYINAKAGVSDIKQSVHEAAQTASHNASAAVNQAASAATSGFSAQAAQATHQQF
ncbi:hypothetical protein TBLA_0I00970 [Henningerozyma blattae CBS 6284]|uniref:Protein YOP1 n=1 Tax=Henningerozyma blattae (strain ATCC 34711 / CBS 6284 / DSM 70876 / NBRC 10599 / NRRL Y-10934 / UCD 77-7) TaxID=1071380 RepID=I2H8Q4_HENB6|nr:hypothetical protein TBLA_0I00970 [Tetrapisispora blattae CBS 6284]CCH62756.1 hypothetical protein TBLA_0I00970 [Tetrapisispora blattae CBS 6284]